MVNCANIFLVLKKFQDLVIIALAATIPVLLVWAPFFFRIENFWGIELPQNGMATIIANFDGPYYIAVAKSFYNPAEIEKFQFPLPKEYYAAHFPGFPLFIRALSPIFGYPWAMMLTTLLTGITALWFFYLLLHQNKLGKYALWLTLVFAVFPARWLIVRSVGSPEPLFITSVLATFYFFLREKYWFAGLAGVIAMATKSPGILIFAASALAIIAPRIEDLFINPIKSSRSVFPKLLPLVLIPATVLVIFIFYSKQYGDFFAYFNSGDNIHLQFPPFQVFNAAQTWVGTFWLEEIIWIYLIALLGVFQLIKNKQFTFAWFVGIFTFSTLFVSHRDIARYILPIVPFLFVAFSGILISKPFKWALLFLLIPIYLFSLNFIIGNITPIADWGPLL